MKKELTQSTSVNVKGGGYSSLTSLIATKLLLTVHLARITSNKGKIQFNPRIMSNKRKSAALFVSHLKEFYNEVSK